MKTLHTFGCSITQGFALPDVVQSLFDDNGVPLTPEYIEQHDIQINWEDIHLYQPSKYAWPQILGNQLDMRVQNYARRGACFQQISRQCAVEAKNIQPNDTVIVMWTYLSRLSMQWPTRTTVPFCNIVDRNNWQTVMLGFNKFFGLSNSDHKKTDKHTLAIDAKIQHYIEKSTKHTYLDPLGVYNRYYNSMVLQQMTDGFLRATGAQVIHLSVETNPTWRQLKSAADQLDPSLWEYTDIPHPDEWYNISVDHDTCKVIHDPSIPPAENDQHPSVLHHSNFAETVHRTYFA